MNLRIKLKKPSIAGLTGHFLCGDSEQFLLSDIYCKIYVDNELVFDVSDLSSFSDTNVNTSTGVNFNIASDVIDEILKVSIMYPNDTQNVDVYTTESCTFRIEIGNSTNGTYYYSNTFLLFSYDLGNDPTNGKTGLPDFTLYMMDNGGAAQNSPFAAFIAYQRPFTTQLYVYSAFGGAGTYNYYNGATDELVESSPNFVTCAPDGLSLYLTNGYNGQTCTNGIQTYPALKWFPDYSVALTLCGCVDDCASTGKVNKATAFIDFANLSERYINDFLSYFSKHFTLSFLLYDQDGNLESFENKGFQINNSSESYNPLDYEFSFTPLKDGAYLLKVILGAYENYLDGIQDSGALSSESWYKIYTNPNGTDFTFVGAMANTEGKSFFSTTGATPLWNSAALLINDVTKQCVKTLLMDACLWLKITKGETCGEYVVSNNSSYSATVTLKKYTKDNNTLDVIQTFVLTPFNTATLELTDGAYIVDGLIDTGAKTTIQAHLIEGIEVSCAVDTCLAGKINDLFCDCLCSCDEDCEDKCSKFYDFNAFVILLHTYRALVEQDLKPSNLLTLVEADMLESLYNIEEMRLKLEEYCASCDAGCGCSD